MSGREDVAVGDEDSAAVAGRPIPHEGGHPRPLLGVGVLSANNASGRPLGDETATCGGARASLRYVIMDVS